jgi:hypothetical protein
MMSGCVPEQDALVGLEATPFVDTRFVASEVKVGTAQLLSGSSGGSSISQSGSGAMARMGIL